MADDKVQEALLVVTKRVIANALRTDYPIAPEWENYPEIGEWDWVKIIGAIEAEVAARYGVNPESYDAAYEFLSQRADAE